MTRPPFPELSPCMYVCIYIHTYVYIYIYIYICVNQIHIKTICSNVSRAEESAAALKTNAVLKQRDLFLATTFKEVPSRLVKRARIQPVFDQQYLIGSEAMEAMSDSLKITQGQLAATVLERDNKRYHRYKRGSRGGQRQDSYKYSRDNSDSFAYTSKSSKVSNYPSKRGSRTNTSSPPSYRGNSYRSRGFARGARRGGRTGRPFVKSDSRK